MRKLLALALAVAPLAACTPRHGTAGAVTPAMPTMVNVRNLRFYDMDVYVSRAGGIGTRLGTVTAASTARFTIPSAVLPAGGATLRFYADPIGPTGVRMSEDLSVQPGDVVQIDIIQ